MSTTSACVPGGADFGSRTAEITSQPSHASVRATSRPMPRLAPVISAVLAVIAMLVRSSAFIYGVEQRLDRAPLVPRAGPWYPQWQISQVLSEMTNEPQASLNTNAPKEVNSAIEFYKIRERSTPVSWGNNTRALLFCPNPESPRTHNLQCDRPPCNCPQFCG